MSAFHLLADIPPSDWLRQRVYAGDLLVVRSVPAMQDLLEYCRELLVTTFESQAPVYAQFDAGRSEWDRRAVELRARCRRDGHARALMAMLFTQFGFDPGRTAADMVNLRCQPHDDAPHADPRHTLGAHRDTWGSNVYQQINWWAPVYPVTPERTIAFFPSYWHRPLANDSADWNLDTVRAELRAARTAGREPCCRKVPEPTEVLDLTDRLPVAIEPGDVMLFSGAHLHASVPNRTGAARFSVELRTVDLHDAAIGVGAPNVDGAAPVTAWHWFRRLDNGRPLEDPLQPGAAVPVP